MKLFRARNLAAVELMKDKLLPDEDFNQEDLVESIEQALVEAPEDIYLLQAWEGKVMVGFLIAYNLPKQNHVFLLQVWADPTVERLSDKMFFRMLFWAQSLGKKEIRAETKRNTEAIQRRWDFQEVSKIVSYKIPDDLEERIMASSRNKGDSNGQQVEKQETSDREQTNTEPDTTEDS